LLSKAASLEALRARSIDETWAMVRVGCIGGIERTPPVRQCYPGLLLLASFRATLMIS
jgi:hypothetical protein